MIHTATPATLLTVLKGAAADDIVDLAPGNYGAVALSKLAFDPPVTIRAQGGATIGSLNIVQCKGLDFENLAVSFIPTATTLSHFSAVRFFQCERISLRGSTLTGGPAVNGVPQDATKLDSTGNVVGLPCGRAVTVQDCKDIILTSNDISAFHTGIVPSKVDGLLIDDNDIHGLRTSPITGGNVDNVTITRNRLGGSKPWRFGLSGGDHGDYIHLWTVAGRTGPSKGIVIRDNLLDQGDGFPMLGIYLDDNKLGIGFADVEISDNLIVNAMRQAIQVERTTGRILRNTMVTPTEIAQKNLLPTVMVWDGSVVDVSGNFMSMKPNVGGTPTGQWTGGGNVIADRADYPKVFADGWKAVVAAGPTSLRTAIEAAKPSPLTPDQEARVREIVREMGGA